MPFLFRSRPPARSLCPRCQVLVQIAQHLFQRPALSKIASGIATVCLPPKNVASAPPAQPQDYNQIDDVCRDIEATVHQVWRFLTSLHAATQPRIFVRYGP